jgi:lysophospholipase L1-like esterase
MIKYYYEGKIYMDYGISKRFTEGKSIKLTRELIEELNEKAAKMFYFQYGKSDSTIQLCRQNKIPLISLGINFTPAMYHENDSHFNPEGHKVIGERFYELLTKHHVIPQKFKSQENPID